MLNGHVVPELPCDLSLHGLEIAEPRLRLDRIGTAVPIHEGIPRPGISLTSERHLDAPSQRSGDARSKPFEQPELADVAHRVAVGIEPEARFEADRGTQSTEPLETDVPGGASLETGDLAGRDPSRSPHVFLAQPGSESGIADVGDHCRCQSA